MAGRDGSSASFCFNCLRCSATATCNAQEGFADMPGATLFPSAPSGCERQRAAVLSSPRGAKSIYGRRDHRRLIVDYTGVSMVQQFEQLSKPNPKIIRTVGRPRMEQPSFKWSGSITPQKTISPAKKKHGPGSKCPRQFQGSRCNSNRGSRIPVRCVPTSSNSTRLLLSGKAEYSWNWSSRARARSPRGPLWQGKARNQSARCCTV